jgi:hypothetical protein
MSCNTANKPLTACEMLNQALASVQEAAAGGAIAEIRLRDRSTRFQESTMASRLRYLQSLVMNKAVFGRCPNYHLAAAASGIPQGRSPAVAVFGQVRYAQQNCGCGPIENDCGTPDAGGCDDGC